MFSILQSEKNLMALRIQKHLERNRPLEREREISSIFKASFVAITKLKIELEGVLLCRYYIYFKDTTI